MQTLPDSWPAPLIGFEPLVEATVEQLRHEAQG